MSVDQVVVDPAVVGYPVPLQTTDTAATYVSATGYMVGCPQDCASNHNGGLQPIGPLYVSPEWIMEIIYVTDKTLVGEARTRYAHRIQNAPLAKGCGRISKNVYLTQVQKNGSRWYETRDLKLYYALADQGTYSGASYLPGRVCISANEWDATNSYILGQVAEIQNNLPPQSDCT